MSAVVPFEGQKVAAAFANLNPSQESLSDGIGSSYAVISYKGSKWSIKHKGETKMFLRADGSPTDTLNVIVLRAASTKSKSYFKKYDPDNPNVRPVCWSMDAITPADDVEDKQASACALCPKNQAKKNAEGRRVRECSDFKRLAVLIHPKQSAAALGQALLEPVFLRVPASSLSNLSKFGDEMGQGGKGFHYSTYVTQIKFDPLSEFPKMVFSPMAKGLLTEEEAQVVMELRELPVAYRITGELPETAEITAVEEVEELTAGGIGLVEAKAQAATQEVIAPEPKQIEQKRPASVFDMADVEEAEVVKVAAPAPKQTAADTGVVEADEELLARIQGMLKK